MSHLGGVSQWIAEVSSRFGVLLRGLDARASARFGVLALWDGAEPIVRADHGGHVPGNATGDDLRRPAPTIA